MGVRSNAVYVCGPGAIPGACPWCGAGLVQGMWNPPECAAECGWAADVSVGPDTREERVSWDG